MGGRVQKAVSGVSIEALADAAEVLTRSLPAWRRLTLLLESGRELLDLNELGVFLPDRSSGRLIRAARAGRSGPRSEVGEEALAAALLAAWERGEPGAPAPAPSAPAASSNRCSTRFRSWPPGRATWTAARSIAGGKNS